MSAPFSQLDPATQLAAVEYLLKFQNNPPSLAPIGAPQGALGVLPAGGGMPTQGPSYWAHIDAFGATVYWIMNHADNSGYPWAFWQDFYQNHGPYGDDQPITQQEWDQATGNVGLTPPAGSTRDLFVRGWAFDTLHPNPQGIGNALLHMGETLVGGVGLIVGGAGLPLLTAGLKGFVDDISTAASGGTSGPPKPASMPKDLADAQDAYIAANNAFLTFKARARVALYASIALFGVGGWLAYRGKLYEGAGAFGVGGLALYYSARETKLQKTAFSPTSLQGQAAAYQDARTQVKGIGQLVTMARLQRETSSVSSDNAKKAAVDDATAALRLFSHLY